MNNSSIYNYSDADEMLDLIAQESESQAVNEFRDIFLCSYSADE